MSNTNREKKIANAIGATHIIQVTDKKMGTPLSWLKLVHELKNKMVSSGGRPSDPYWDTKRLVPFRRQIWNFLSSEAKELSRTGRKVGPAQLAASIIEAFLRKDSDLK